MEISNIIPQAKNIPAFCAKTYPSAYIHSHSIAVRRLGYQKNQSSTHE